METYQLRIKYEVVNYITVDVIADSEVEAKRLADEIAYDDVNMNGGIEVEVLECKPVNEDLKDDELFDMWRDEQDD